MGKWTDADLLTHTINVGGSAVIELTAVAVMPWRPPSCAVVMIETAPASWRIPVLNSSLLIDLFTPAPVHNNFLNDPHEQVKQVSGYRQDRDPHKHDIGLQEI
jgi:hypothetical protein